MTYVIVNDRGEFFMWFSCGVDEFDNVCCRACTWTKDWQSAKVWETRRAADRALIKVQGRECLTRSAVVG